MSSSLESARAIGSGDDEPPRDGGSRGESVSFGDLSTMGRIGDKVRRRLFTSPPPAARIGRFVILNEIGRGAMGMVYAAFDEQLDRKIAIKVMLEDDLPTEEERLRFQREAQALARLSHPHVVTIHEVGQSEGRTFLAMEYIRGQSLSSWLRSEPEWSQVLDAYRQAGRGLMAAHASGVLHRDFKPHNVMRSDDGYVKVLDFGVAQVVSETLESVEEPSSLDSSSSSSVLTKTGAVVGTPAYMAPERFTERTVDARSDQYSFCVALWEGLTGSRPFEGSDLISLQEAKLAGPPSWAGDAPPVPRRVVEALRRGLSAAPGERFGSMEALLDELDEPAEPPPRRWVLVVTSVAALGLGGSWAFAHYTRAEERCTGAGAKLAGVWDDARRGDVRAAITGTALPFAPQTWERVEQRLDEYAGAWAQQHTEACEATTVRGEQSSEVMDLRMRCLDARRRELEATVAVLADADDEVVRRAHELEAGLPPPSGCADIEALVAEVEPPPPADAEAVEEVRRRLARAAALRIAARYDDARVTLASAIERLGSIEYGPVRAELAYERGRLLVLLGEYEPARVTLMEAAELATRWGRPQLLHSVLRQLMYALGSGLHEPEAAMALAPLIRGGAGDDLEAELGGQNVIGIVLRAQGQPQESEAVLRGALSSLERAHDVDPYVVASLRSNLANALIEQGKLVEAEAELRAAIGLHTEALGSAHPTTTKSRGNLVAVLSRQGKHEDAEREALGIVSQLADSLGPDHPEARGARVNYVTVLSRAGKHEQVEAEVRALLASTDGREEPDGLRTALLHATLGRSLRGLRRLAEAEAEFRASLELLGAVLGPEHPRTLEKRSNLAAVLRDRGMLDEAEAEFRGLLEIRERTMDADQPSTAVVRARLADLLVQRHEEAETASLTEALSLAEAAWSVLHHDRTKPEARGSTAYTLAKILWSIEGAARDRTRALRLAEEAMRAYEALGARSAAEYEEVQRWRDEHRRAELQ